MKNKLKTIKLFEDFLKKEEELKSQNAVNQKKAKEPEPEPQEPEEEQNQEEEENLLSEIKKYYKRKGW